jgi:uncharacterized protein with von Willebrand factor type A (vWA) domain
LSGSSSVPHLLRGVDRAAFSAAFAVRLRAAGVPVDLTAIELLTQALGRCSTASRRDVYWVTRVCLVRRHADLAAFDAAFEAVFGALGAALVAVGGNGSQRPGAPRPHDPATGARRHDAKPAEDDDKPPDELPWLTLAAMGAARGRQDGPEPERAVPDPLPSRVEAVADTPFEDLDDAQLALLSDWFAAATRTWPARRTRRMRPHPHGRRVELRPTLARSRRTGWEPVQVVRGRPVDAGRRLVMLCDVSQSMSAHARAYLHLMRAAVLSVDAEVFAFATSLTRLTAVLAHRSAPAALDRATDVVIDRFGGTRIASNVRALLTSRHGNATRGAIVLIASDGWDADDPAELAAAMARLRRRAHRVIWLNPRAAAPGFAPLTGAMSAALPFCDELLPAHTPRAMTDVLAAITGSRVSSRA